MLAEPGADALFPSHDLGTTVRPLAQSAGFVLVGGQSSRMGRDKALLAASNGPLASEVAETVAQVAGSVALVGRPDAYRHLGYECLNDILPGGGPLSGLHAALASARAEYNLILACDMPGISCHLLRELLQFATTCFCHQSRTLCVATVDRERQVHPLCAVYRRTALLPVENALRTGHYCLMDLLHDLGSRHFLSSHPVMNCNTPEEWASFTGGAA